LLIEGVDVFVVGGAKEYLEVGGPLDLNFNSAKTEILIDDKWKMVEQLLVKFIFTQLSKSVSAEYLKAFISFIKLNITVQSRKSFWAGFISI